MGAPPLARGGVLSAAGERPARRWRLLRGLAALLVIGLFAVAAAIVGAAVWARSEGGRAWLRDQLVGLVGPVHGTLTAGSLETDLFSTATLRDVTLTGPDGARIAHVDTLSVRYRLGGLTSRRLVVPEARVEGLELVLTRTDAGLDIAGLWDDGSPPSDEPWGGLPIDLVLSAVTIAPASVTWREPDATYGVAGATLTGAVELRGEAVLVTGLMFAAPTTTPDVGPMALAGDIRWDPHTLWLEDLSAALGPNRLAIAGGLGRLDGDTTVGIGIRALHVEPASLAPIVGPLPVTGAFDATGGVAGLLSAPTALLEVVTPGGPLHASASVDLRGPRPTWMAQLVPNNVALHAFLPDVPVPTVLRGAISADGEGFGWPDDLDLTATVALEAPRLAEWSDLAVNGTVRLSGGVLDLEGLRASAPGVAVKGGGTVRVLDQAGEVALTEARADLRVLSRFGVPEARGTATFRGNTRFGWGERLGAHVDGTLRGARVGWADLGTAETASGPVTVDWSPEGGVDAVGNLALTGLVVPGTTAATATLDGRVSVAANGALDATATVTLGEIAASGLTAASVAGDVRLSRTKHLEMEADLVTADLAWAGWRSDTGTARLRLDGDVATARVELLDGARSMVVFDGEADLAARSVRARELVVAPTDDLAWRAEGVQTVRIVEGGVADVRIRLTSDSGLVVVEGGGAKKGMIDLRVEARDVRIERVAALLPGRFDGYGGRVTLRASMEGHASRPALYADLSAVDLTIPDVVRRLDIDVQGVGGDRRLKLDGVLSSGGRRLARLEGDLPFSLAVDAPGLLPDGDLDLRLLVPPAGSETWSAVLPGEPLPPFRASAEVVLTGPVLDPKLAVVGIVDAPVGQSGEWVRLDVDAQTTGGQLDLRAVARERLERRLEVVGGVALHLGDVAKSLFGKLPARDLGDPDAWIGDLDVNVVPMRLPIQVLAGFVEGLPARLDGDLSGGLNVSGTLAAPRVQGALLLAEGKLGELELSPAEVVLAAQEGGYDVTARLGFGNQSAVSVAGFVPFAPPPGGALADELRREGLDLRVIAEAVPLTAVAAAWPQLEATAGTFSMDGVVRGALLDPAPDLGFGLADADFFLVQTGIRYADARLQGRLTKDTLSVEGLHVRTLRLGSGDDGRIEGSVNARREGDRPIFDGSVTLHRAWLVDLPERRLRMNGTLRLGERARKVRVSGRLTVLDGNLVVPERFFTGASDLALGADVRVLRRGAAPSAERTAAAGFVFPSWLETEVAVNLDRAAFLEASMPMEQLLGRGLRALSSIQLSTQLDGEVAVRIEGGELSLVGEVRPLRGLARVFNRPFDLRGETISFTGRDYTNPVLDLVAVHESAEDGPITTEITGTPSSLRLAFTAEDETLAQEDILGVLLTGRRLSELGAGEGDAVGALLTSGILGIADDLGSGAGLFDVFELDTTHLRVGSRIRADGLFKADLFLLGEYDWMADPEEENVGQVTLEWRVGRRWQFDLTTGTSGFSSLSLNRRWRF